MKRPTPIATPTLFRELLSGFASGVTVATALDRKGRPHGMTASAVASLSLEPPLVVVCVDRTADLHAILESAPCFALSVLAADQEHLSRRFAEDRSDRWDGIAHSIGLDGLPLLDGALGHITCRKWGSYGGGDHTIFVGQVSGGRLFDRKPLLHFRRGLRDDDVSTASSPIGIEILDGPDCPPGLARATLSDIARSNTLFGGRAGGMAWSQAAAQP